MADLKGRYLPDTNGRPVRSDASITQEAPASQSTYQPTPSQAAQRRSSQPLQNRQFKRPLEQPTEVTQPPRESVQTRTPQTQKQQFIRPFTQVSPDISSPVLAPPFLSSLDSSQMTHPFTPQNTLQVYEYEVTHTPGTTRPPYASTTTSARHAAYAPVNTF